MPMTSRSRSGLVSVRNPAPYDVVVRGVDYLTWLSRQLSTQEENSKVELPVPSVKKGAGYPSRSIVN